MACWTTQLREIYVSQLQEWFDLGKLKHFQIYLSWRSGAGYGELCAYQQFRHRTSVFWPRVSTLHSCAHHILLSPVASPWRGLVQTTSGFPWSFGGPLGHCPILPPHRQGKPLVWSWCRLTQNELRRNCLFWCVPHKRHDSFTVIFFGLPQLYLALCASYPDGLSSYPIKIKFEKCWMLDWGEFWKTEDVGSDHHSCQMPWWLRSQAFPNRDGVTVDQPTRAKIKLQLLLQCGRV